MHTKLNDINYTYTDTDSTLACYSLVNTDHGDGGFKDIYIDDKIE